MTKRNTGPVLELHAVQKRYRLGEQTIQALRGVDFTIEKGDFVAIMGPSGSGKSTLLQIASLLDNPSEGEVILHGMDVSKYSETELAKVRNQEIGFVFQQFNLLAKTSAWENVALPLVYANVSPAERQQRAQAMLEQVGLGERLENTRAQLSGGQQQRVAIARALINDPTIIFADEPTGNLDTKSGDEIMGILQNFSKEGRTIVMVTHEEDIAAYAHRIVHLRDGLISSDQKNGKK
ncbi:ABC transporter ATP-binding protein [Candidatus Woesebacteria bacterium]|nr:ABC transporter ATP-binding protein [Candidatus Woesebacteria bacterium]MCD8507592.1 ABC transporter ATP-binding protein [Candidatus Woesebacteria bacterium]MCD8527435.1 ABC transporter ATP-binding protein [Candidatus Woesebacteria bacterium]MCD8546178.1 ABC transporter ATP-binding protein [Candidatus Woesebacteria bacterium]